MPLDAEGLSHGLGLKAEGLSHGGYLLTDVFAEVNYKTCIFYASTIEDFF